MYTKIIINMNGKEIIFKAHEIVVIARSVIENYLLPEDMNQQLHIYTPKEYRALVSLLTSEGSDMDIIDGSIDPLITVPMHVQGIDSAFKWLYLSRSLYKRHQQELETHTLLSVYADKEHPSDQKIVKVITEDTNDYTICLDATGKTMELKGKEGIKLHSVIDGTWVEIAGRLILVKNSAQMTFYVSDHGCLHELIEKVKELVFETDWTNPELASMLVKIQRDLEAMTPNEKAEFEGKLINSIRDENIEVFRLFYPGCPDAAIEEIRLHSLSNPKNLLLDIIESNRYIIHSLIKKYMQMKFYDETFRGFDNEIYKDFYVYNEDGNPIKEEMNIEGIVKTFEDRREDASNLIKRIVVQMIADEINCGIHEPLFRPISSYGDRDAGSSYHVFEYTVVEYLLQDGHLSEAEIAETMREVLRGITPDLRGANFIPNLIAAWFVAEPTRNPTSLLSGLMLLDMMENNVELMDDQGNNWYNLQNTLIHPLKSKAVGKIKDLYGSNEGIDRFGGAHPMAHDGSVADSKEIRKNSKLTPVHQKVASLIFHWLSLYLDSKGVKCRLVSDTEEKLQQSDIDFTRVSSNFEDSEHLIKLKKKIESVEVTIRVKEKKGEDAKKYIAELAKLRAEEAELILKQVVEMKFIIPALQERLTTLDNLILLSHPKEKKYINISPAYEVDELKVSISYALQSTYPNQEIFEILPVSPDGNCMYNSIREGLIRLPLSYTGNRFITLEELRRNVAEEIELAPETDMFLEYAQDIRTQLLANVIEGDVIGFNTMVGNRLSALTNFYLQLINSGSTVNNAQEQIAQAIDDTHLVDAYINMIRENNSWGGNVELRIMAEDLEVQFIVHRRDGVNIRINDNPTLPIIHLDYNGGHYNLITNLAHYEELQSSIPTVYENFTNDHSSTTSYQEDESASELVNLDLIGLDEGSKFLLCVTTLMTLKYTNYFE